MSDTILQALIIAGGAFAGSFLGTVVQPVLQHYLRGRAQYADRVNANARAQFSNLYKPLYDMFEGEMAPDDAIEDITPDMRDRIVALVDEHRDLAQPVLEQSIRYIKETAWMAGGAVDFAELRKVYNHVTERYEALRKELGKAHHQWWRVYSPRSLYRRARWSWTMYAHRRRMRTLSRARAKREVLNRSKLALALFSIVLLGLIALLEATADPLLWIRLPPWLRPFPVSSDFVNLWALVGVSATSIYLLRPFGSSQPTWARSIFWAILSIIWGWFLVGILVRLILLTYAHL